jgi:hypothetical protein
MLRQPIRAQFKFGVCQSLRPKLHGQCIGRGCRMFGDLLD